MDRDEEDETFGTCEECGSPRKATVEDGELVLVCRNGHQST